MYKIIGFDGKEYGPVSADDIREWIRTNRVGSKSMAQGPGDSNWRPLSSFPEFAGLFAGTLPPPVLSAEEAERITNEVLERPIDIQIGGSISRSWGLYKENFTSLFIATLIIFAASSVAGAIPYLGVIAGTILHGVLYAGLYWYFLKIIRGQKAELPDAFAGFTRFFPQLLIAGLIIGLVPLMAFCLSALPFLLSFVPMIFSAMHGHNIDAGALLGTFTVLGILSLFAGMCVAFFFYLMWVFTTMLIIDKGMPFWPAMELSRKVFFRAPGSIFGLVFLAGLAGFSGVLLCGIGVLLTAPITFGAIVYAYKDIFEPQRHND